jgi:hypothetical protein
MKSVRIHEYGGRETLRYEESPMPQMSNQDVLVKVIAAPVTGFMMSVNGRYYQADSPIRQYRSGQRSLPWSMLPRNR